MNKSSQKQTNTSNVNSNTTLTQLASLKYKTSAQPVTKQWISKAPINKFKGMAEDIEEVQPEIIPGYTIRG